MEKVLNYIYLAILLFPFAYIFACKTALQKLDKRIKIYFAIAIVYLFLAVLYILIMKRAVLSTYLMFIVAIYNFMRGIKLVREEAKEN